MDFIINLLLKYPGICTSVVQTIIYSLSLILLVKGLWTLVRGFIHVKKVSEKVIHKEISKPITAKDPLALVTAKIFHSAYSENIDSERMYPRSFVEDAAKQIASNEFDISYTSVISNIANLFPPLGFIGTVFGMIFIFLAKTDPNSNLNTLGLGAALFTTLGALVCFVIIDGLRSMLERKAIKRINEGIKVTIKEEKRKNEKKA